jgi:alkylated DNA repair protein alkB homolog 1
LGGQYDWTAKQYPSAKPPEFPKDIGSLLASLFANDEGGTSMVPQAAICNLYSPGDTLSLHRDVAEDCDQPLVSVSIGCDAIFVVGVEGPGEHASRICKPLVLRLRSGDVVVMSGPSRFAWHGVAQIIPHTCPKDLEDWPASDGDVDGEYEYWRGWMKQKRINLNVRQMNA